MTVGNDETEVRDMGDYTKVNVDAIEDVASQVGAQDRQEARFAAGALGMTETGLAIHRMKPGRRQGFGHRHENAEEVCMVLDGSGRVRLDDDMVELDKGDILRIGATVARRFEAGPDGMEFIVFGPHHPKDGELLPDFWADGDASA